MTSKQRWVLGLTAIASLMVALDVTVVSTALSTMRLHLHASIAQLEWTVNAYGLSFAVLLMTGAILGDRLGRRRLFVGGLALFSVASAACALSTDVGWLIAARAVQGAGAAVIAPLSLSLLSAAFPPERRGSALGIYGAITGLAVVAGPVVGGAVTQGLAWPWIFWLNVPIGLAAIPFVLARIDEGFGPRAAADGPGLALVTGAALGIVWGLVRGNTVGWGSLEVVGTLAAGALCSVLFVVWELRASEPMLPMKLFRSRGFAAGNVVSLLMFSALFSAVFFMAQYQQTVLGQSPLNTGLRLIPWTGTVLLVSPLAGALVDRIGERPLIVSGLVMQAAGFAWFALIARTGLPYSHMIAPLILAGVGISTALPAVQNAVLGGVPQTEIGKASGTFSTMRQLGGALGLAAAVAVFSGAGSYASPEAFSNGFKPAIAVCAALSLCGGLVGLALRARSRGAISAVPALEAVGGR
ncbi:MAG TPA: DHA2 family efflux MFS transporter permease subunit [Solirubrobacteraceae bacterium]|jgi:EmrB/QacA subfamily drug resistance transporter|nr:DHA2 family efflux MFS transporter permease subunit [Solirubrobacteraceae bacterium]